MRTIGVVTVARSDYGIYQPLLKKIRSDPELQLQLFVTGMHLSPEFGFTVRVIEEDGFHIQERIEMLLSSDTPEGIAKSMGLGTVGFAQAFARSRPDILVVLGDRFEMHAAVVASIPFRIPVAHIHGGESTEGAIDELLRHSITKMSHLHFASTELYAQRIMQMGESPWRVKVSGAPSLDNLHTVDILSQRQLEDRFGLKLKEPILLVTYHPVTLEYENTERYTRELLAALTELDFTMIFTYPNADTQGRLIIDRINEFTDQHKLAQVAVNLGTQGYFSLMAHSAAMVGNSSSGIIEAASFKLPVVNIGNRQRGRIHGDNVIGVGYSKDEILNGIVKAVSREFQALLEGLTNPYGDGHAGQRIVNTIKEVDLDDQLLHKIFYEIGVDVNPKANSGHAMKE